MTNQVPVHFSSTWSTNQEIHEETRFLISKVVINGDFVDHFEVNFMNTYLKIPHEADLTRKEIINFMKNRANGFYFNDTKLILETIDGAVYIHKEKSGEKRDILE